jgi:hypothetical protein
MTTTAACPVHTLGRRFSASPCDEPRSASWDIVPAPQDFILEDGEFVIESFRGVRRICRLTGRQRWIRSDWRAATIETFDVETVVRNLPDGTPSIWGVRGERIAGTWAINTAALV